MSETKEIRKEWIGHGINCMTVWMLTDFCYQAGRIGNVCLHPCCGSGGCGCYMGRNMCLFDCYLSKSGRIGRSPGFNYAGEHGAIYFGDHTRGWIYCLYGWETSLQYPEHFSMDKREVSLQGNALFDVTGNRERPFLIETEEVRIEVLGTMFHVKSDVGSTFELSVQRGKVKVALKNKNQEMYVNAGEAVTLKTHQLRFTDYRDDTRIAHYWKSMRFKDESLMNILRVINMHSSGLQLRLLPP